MLKVKASHIPFCEIKNEVKPYLELDQGQERNRTEIDPHQQGKLPIVPMNALDNSIPERMEEILTRLFQEYFEGLQIAQKL